MAVAEGIAALNSLRNIYEIAKDVRNSNDTEKLRTAAAQMFDLAIAAREQTALLQEERNSAVVELAALKAEIEKSQRFDDEAKNYARELTESGATVYREKNAAGSQGKSPYFCPNCFADKRISIMNPAKWADTGRFECDHACGLCKLHMPLYVLRPAGY